MSRLILAAALLAGSIFAADAARPPIVDAAKNGDKDTVRALIQKKVDVNAAEADGTTALHWASYRDDLETADLLLRAGAKANAANDLGATPLWAASENGSAAMVKKLLDAGANPNAALLAGETPVMVASRSGYPELVELLIAKGANVNAHGTRGQTALMWAVSQQHPDVVKVLLAHHADVNLKSDVWTDVMAVPPHGYLPYNKAVPHGGETALMFAARVGDLASAKLLVAAGANVKDADAWGISATTLAAHSGFTDFVLFLLDKGADPNAAPNGFTALHEAIMRRDEKMVAALLDHHADPNAPLLQWTPTRRSSEDFHFEPYLVGATPYWLAARFDEPSVMRMLAAHGADPMFVFHAKWVAEQGFGQTERSDTMTTLLAAVGVGGGNARPWVDAGRAEKEALTLEAVKLIVEAGVDVNAKTNDGRTALDGATNLRYKSVVEFLTGKGAKAGTGGGGRGGRGGGRGRAAEPPSDSAGDEPK
jgi:ankyrin repeat protein